MRIIRRHICRHYRVDQIYWSSRGLNRALQFDVLIMMVIIVVIIFTIWLLVISSSVFRILSIFSLILKQNEGDFALPTTRCLIILAWGFIIFQNKGSNMHIWVCLVWILPSMFRRFVVFIIFAIGLLSGFNFTRSMIMRIFIHFLFMLLFICNLTLITLKLRLIIHLLLLELLIVSFRILDQITQSFRVKWWLQWGTKVCLHFAFQVDWELCYLARALR
jgi:hypothetical protein